jgi:hypothetical protein
VQTRRDHVYAYQFMVNRMTSALVLSDPAATDPPTRRARLGLILGVRLAALAVGVFWVFGLIRPGVSQAWRQQGVILLEEETGTRYVMVGGDLHPTRHDDSSSSVVSHRADVLLQPPSGSRIFGGIVDD